MTPTPISDAIESLSSNWTSTKYDDFLRLLAGAGVGVCAVGVPPELVGRTINHTPPGVTLGSTSHGGKSRILAYADPKEFIRKFGGQCNGEMPGSELFRVVLHNPDCGGILLNSALKEISFPVEREDIERFVATSSKPKQESQKHAWWRRWLPQ